MIRQRDQCLALVGGSSASSPMCTVGRGSSACTIDHLISLTGAARAFGREAAAVLMPAAGANPARHGHCSVSLGDLPDSASSMLSIKCRIGSPRWFPLRNNFPATPQPGHAYGGYSPRPLVQHSVHAHLQSASGPYSELFMSIRRSRPRCSLGRRREGCRYRTRRTATHPRPGRHFHTSST